MFWDMQVGKQRPFPGRDKSDEELIRAREEDRRGTVWAGAPSWGILGKN